MVPIDHVPEGRTARRCLPTTALVLAMTLGMPLTSSAMRVVRDPITGELRGPTAAEAAAFAKAEAQLRANSGKPAPKAPVEIHHPDGTVETKLGDDTLMHSVVRANEDGSLVMDCLPADQAKAFVAAPGEAGTTKTAVKKGQRHD